ncbi:glycosyltransferase family 4 protein [Microbulbifer sp. SSSA008]|uniref:glycosyltransferase family 4 protein n=1 Tax=Microbulbifer sp. SSSA008 TaxID=3243380 RepID=UPI0040391CE0
MARIAVDARPLAAVTTGIGRYTYALLERMFKSDHEWYLYSHAPLLRDFSGLDNVTVRCGNVPWGSMSSPFAQVVFPIWARRDRVEVFWSPRHHLPVFLPTNITKVVTIHDLVWRNFPQTMSRLGWLLESLLMPPTLRLADSVIAVSESTMLELVEFFDHCEGKVSVIQEAPFLGGGGVPVVLGDYFLFVGTLEPRKNLNRLLYAFKRYINLVDNPLPLKVCGGKGWGGVEVDEIVSELGLEGYVEVLGYVEDYKLAELYRNARALLIPSLYEGFGLPIVEAFSQGTPVLTSNRGAMKEVGGDGAFLIDPEAPEAIAQALKSLSEDISIVRELQKCALVRAGQFSWGRAAKDTLSILER